MNNGLVERLLFEEESPTLDFKKEQYRFAKASKDEKAELLKDILGFANAWRRSEGYILIGVEEVRGGRSKVTGIPATEHLDDHSLQQFVNRLTNRPVRFHYEAFRSEGKNVGIIRIDKQTRPIYLKRPYGKLEKHQVYIRRGTSTDPTSPALPEEVALMGQVAEPEPAELVVEFAHIERENSLGTKISFDAEFCEMPPADNIPYFNPARYSSRLGTLEDPMNQTNPDYYRALAAYASARRLFRPVRILVRNVGRVAAQDVRCELRIPADIGVVVKDGTELPRAPKKMSYPWDIDALASINGPSLNMPGAVEIDSNTDRYRIEIDCGDLQPGRPVWSEVFYIGKAESGDIELSGTIYTTNLPEPAACSLWVSAQVTQSVMTVDELLNLSPPKDSEE